MWSHHYNDRESACKLNLWSPVSAKPQDIEDTSFSCFVEHRAELDAIVDKICGGPLNGSVNLTAADENDLRYIAKRLQDRGYVGVLTLEDG